MNNTSTIEFKSKTVNPNLPTVFDISPEELKNQLGSVVVVDVRRPDEWVGEYGHIAQAQLMTLNTLPTKINELPKDKTIVFVCRSGGRSAQAAAFAQESGLKDVYNMKGGMIEWCQLNFDSVDKNGG